MFLLSIKKKIKGYLWAAITCSLKEQGGTSWVGIQLVFLQFFPYANDLQNFWNLFKFKFRKWEIQQNLFQLDWICLAPSTASKHFTSQTGSTPENFLQIQSFCSIHPSFLCLGCPMRISRSSLFIKYAYKYIFFLSVRKYVYCKRGAKEATQIDTEKNNSPPYKRTQTTKRAQKNPIP